MKKILLAVTLLIVTNLSYSQTKSKITGNVVADINALLPQGRVTADIMDGINQSPREKELMAKFQAGIAEHQEWFQEQVKKSVDGENMGYHPNLGLTEEEFKEFQEQMDNVEVVSTGQEEIEIRKVEDIIFFKARGRLKMLEGIVIKLDEVSIQMGSHILKNPQTVEITDAKNAFRSKWKGYNWAYEYPNDEDIKSETLDFSNINAKQYKFTLAQMEATGKTFLSIKVLEVEKSQKTINIELPLLLSVD